MRKIFLMVLLMSLVSCEPDIVKKQIDITYLNGDTESITVQYDRLNPKRGIFFNNGCIYLLHYETKYDSPYQNCLVCGVRKFKIN